MPTDEPGEAQVAGKTFGYGWVAADQTAHAQTQALQAAGCEEILLETGGAEGKLQTLMSQLTNGDTVIVWKLDRLGRSLQDLLQILEQFETLGVTLRSLTERFDTQAPSGRLVCNLIAIIAGYERSLIRGQARSVRRTGRPRALTQDELREIRALFLQSNLTLDAIADQYAVARSTVAKYFPGGRRQVMADAARSARTNRNQAP